MPSWISLDPRGSALEALAAPLIGITGIFRGQLYASRQHKLFQAESSMIPELLERRVTKGGPGVTCEG